MQVPVSIAAIVSVYEGLSVSVLGSIHAARISEFGSS